VRQKLLDLYEIQQIDLLIREAEVRQGGIPEKLHELEQQITTKKARVAELSEKRDGLSKEIRILEGMVQAERDKIRKWEKRLNDIRNQREYLALSRETETSKRVNHETENQILEMMTQQEGLEAEMEVLEDQLLEEEVDCESERERVTCEIADMEGNIASEKVRRDALLPNLPKPLLRKYDAIRAKRLGIGLVAVHQGSCEGCHMRLPPQLYNILQRLDSIEQCPSCNRLIFWDGILETPDEPAEVLEANP